MSSVLIPSVFCNWRNWPRTEFGDSWGQAASKGARCVLKAVGLANLVGIWNLLGPFKNLDACGPALRDSDVAGRGYSLDIPIFKISPGDSDEQPESRTTSVEPSPFTPLMYCPLWFKDSNSSKAFLSNPGQKCTPKLVFGHVRFS